MPGFDTNDAYIQVKITEDWANAAKDRYFELALFPTIGRRGWFRQLSSLHQDGNITTDDHDDQSETASPSITKVHQGQRGYRIM